MTSDQQSLSEWREILAGAEEDRQAAWTHYDELSKASLYACNEWYEHCNKVHRLRAKIEQMEKEAQ